jgi:hypothetical protein
MLQELTKRYIVSDNNEIQKLLKTMKKHSRLTYRKLFRQMIEDVSASEPLRKKVKAYYNSFGAAPSEKGGRRTLIEISLDDQTIALASSLAFQLLGKGHFSELGRLLIRYYATKGDTPGKYISLTQSPKALAQGRISPKNNVVEIRKPRSQRDGESKIATSYRLDVETVALLGMLVQSMQMKNNELISYLIEKYKADEDLLDQLRRSPAWAAQIAAVNPVIKRFNLSPQIESLLTKLSFKALGGSNRSAMLRALIRIEADLQGLRMTAPRRRRAKS